MISIVKQRVILTLFHESSQIQRKKSILVFARNKINQSVCIVLFRTALIFIKQFRIIIPMNWTRLMWQYQISYETKITYSNSTYHDCSIQIARLRKNSNYHQNHFLDKPPICYYPDTTQSYFFFLNIYPLGKF